ncbi:Dolichyl-phosphate beta-glucosyltransferase-like 2 [Homarus americanus]|uniref:Dolichyl-phosphate beta-glucosyltransferase-like 2 n=1 Tax=Homarus americanus TaxID=6706 RepID=A0A8J5JXK5_HOMAM|nr:Dolichyl-phosphate beta-glucosyltransferase-like 2 [Homarus americanus]
MKYCTVMVVLTDQAFGMLRSRGQLLLFADADGATTFSEYSKVEASLKDLCTVKPLQYHVDPVPILRKSQLPHVQPFVLVDVWFPTLVWLFAVRGIRDTQCGFKLLTRRTSRILFNSLHVER